MVTQKTIAVLCARTESTRAILANLDSPDILGHGCLSSDHLYQLCTGTRIDAIVIENRVSGFLTGLDILSRLAQDLIRPATVVIADLSSKEHEQASALNVRSVLPAGTTPESIATAVQAVLRTATHDIPQIPHSARLLVRDASYIRPLPQLILRITNFLEDPQASAKSLAKEISTDARITAEVLKTVHSITGRANRGTTRLQDAVGLLGVRRTVALVVSAYILRTTTASHSTLPPEMEQKIRIRSILTAATASVYATILGLPATDTVFVLGLLQDLGMLVMAHELGDHFRHILQRCWSVPQLQFVPYEKNEFGFTHADVSAALLQKWELPSSLVRLVMLHHNELDRIEMSEAELGWLESMQVAEAVADLRDQMSPQRRYTLQKLLDRNHHGGAEFVRSFLLQATSHAKDLMRTFEMSVPEGMDLTQLVARIAAELDVSVGDEEIRTSLSDSFSDDDDDIDDYDDDEPEFPRARIVVVCNDSDLHALMRFHLKDSEYRIEHYSDPLNGIAASHGAVVVLFNSQHPEITGDEFIRRLRQVRVEAPVIFFNGDRTRSSVLAAVRAGAAEYVGRPLDKNLLLQKLRKLDHRSATEPSDQSDHPGLAVV